MKLTLEFDEGNVSEIVTAISLLTDLLGQPHTKDERPGSHPIQVKLLELAGKEDLNKLTLREIGERVGLLHPQSVKHHLQQLEKKGLLI